MRIDGLESKEVVRRHLRLQLESEGSQQGGQYKLQLHLGQVLSHTVPLPQCEREEEVIEGLQLAIGILVQPAIWKETLGILAIIFIQNKDKIFTKVTVLTLMSAVREIT